MSSTHPEGLTCIDKTFEYKINYQCYFSDSAHQWLVSMSIMSVFVLFIAISIFLIREAGRKRAAIQLPSDDPDHKETYCIIAINIITWA